MEAVVWLVGWGALERPGNPFARGEIVEAYGEGVLPPIKVKAHRPRDSAAPSAQPMVFLDRDDVINRGREGYVRDPRQFRFLPGAKAAMKALQRLGYRLAVVTNQDPVAWKLLTEDGLRRIHEKM